jgi:hypothetical protein
MAFSGVGGTERRQGKHLAVDLVPTDGKEHESDDLWGQCEAIVKRCKGGTERTIMRLPVMLSTSSTLKAEESKKKR